jgi:mono/diheme cytochrome c family protein
MIPCKPLGRRLIVASLLLFVFSITKVTAQGADLATGKALFQGKCASCHNPKKDGTGPMLGGVRDNDYYKGDIKKLTNWIRNVNALIASEPRYQALKAQYGGSIMTAYPDIKEVEVEAIFKYVEDVYTRKEDEGTNNQAATSKSNSNAIIFGVISLILGIIALILMQVNSNLKKMSDDAEGIIRPEPAPFYRNKIYIAMGSLIFFVVGGYFVAKGAIGLGRQKDYQPEQPIYYSHTVHAGINQISCLYCHGSAWDSKHAAIPSVNICMNCHKSIQAYEKGPKLYDENGDEINGTNEINKLYKYAGFDPKNAAKWDPSMAKPIEWVKIHNLPDHVYFNHSQHIRAGKVQCQSCHGEITAMDEVKQVSDLSMGWCINCHRESKVDFNYSDSTGNKFYSIYEKFHNDIKNHKLDSVRVKDIGGLECQKCHY